MVAGAHGAIHRLSDLRARFGLGGQGANLRQLRELCESLQLRSRALRLETSELNRLELPCILHWDLNHFVVLKRLDRTHAVIVDPAVGERRLSLKEVSARFTGVAMEATPDVEFRRVKPSPGLGFRDLVIPVRGLYQALGQVFLVACAIELFGILSPLLQQLVIDDILPSGDRSLLTLVAIAFGILLIFQSFLSFLRSWMLVFIGQRVSLQWSENLFSHLIRLPVPYFEQRHLGDIYSRFGSLEAVQKAVASSSIEAGIGGLMAFVALLMMFAYSAQLTAVTLAAVFFYIVLRTVAFSRFKHATADRIALAAQESSHFFETLRAITPIKLFAAEGRRRTRWKNLLVDVRNQDARLAIMRAGFNSSNSILFGMEGIMVLYIGARSILDSLTTPSPEMAHSALSIGMLLAYIGFRTQFVGKISSLIDFWIEVRMLSLHFDRLSDIALTEREPHGARPSCEYDLSSPTIEFRNIGFRHSDSAPWVLRNISLKLDAGSATAVTGESGSGKSTLMKIALGLLQPTEGEVVFCGVPIEKFGMKAYRRQVGAVMQEDTLMSGSISENISFFDEHWDQERIERAAKQAHIHEAILDLPMAYETHVGEFGAGLSGGQKQRLLIARALYKAPSLLLMDEATSHLDTTNEKSVSAGISEMKMTRILVAHRRETILTADRVITLASGRIVNDSHYENESVCKAAVSALS